MTGLVGAPNREREIALDQRQASAQDDGLASHEIGNDLRLGQLRDSPLGQRDQAVGDGLGADLGTSNGAWTGALLGVFLAMQG